MKVTAYLVLDRKGAPLACNSRRDVMDRTAEQLNKPLQILDPRESLELGDESRGLYQVVEVEFDYIARDMGVKDGGNG